MAQQFTLQQVKDHNTQVPFDKWAIIHGEVYRLSQIPWDNCKMNSPSQLPTPWYYLWPFFEHSQTAPHELHWLNLNE